MRARHGNGHAQRALIEVVFHPDSESTSRQPKGPRRRIPIASADESVTDVVPWRVVERDPQRS